MSRKSCHYFFSVCTKFQRSLITCKERNEEERERGGREKQAEADEGEERERKDKLVRLENGSLSYGDSLRCLIIRTA